MKCKAQHILFELNEFLNIMYLKKFKMLLFIIYTIICNNKKYGINNLTTKKIS